MNLLARWELRIHVPRLGVAAGEASSIIFAQASCPTFLSIIQNMIW